MPPCTPDTHKYQIIQIAKSYFPSLEQRRKAIDLLLQFQGIMKQIHNNPTKMPPALSICEAEAVAWLTLALSKKAYEDLQADLQRFLKSAEQDSLRKDNKKDRVTVDQKVYDTSGSDDARKTRATAVLRYFVDWVRSSDIDSMKYWRTTVTAPEKKVVCDASIAKDARMVIKTDKKWYRLEDQDLDEVMKMVWPFKPGESTTSQAEKRTLTSFFAANKKTKSQE